jgi:uncharacterized membrane protein YgdD (TMEM256/DUF423 family)
MTLQKTDTLVLAIAALWGLAGVGSLALGSHADATGLMTTAGQFLLFQAVVVIALISQNLIARPLIPQMLLLIGSGIFAADLIYKSQVHKSLLPAMAPVGGAITIAGWASLVVLAVLALLQSSKEAS